MLNDININLYLDAIVNLPENDQPNDRVSEWHVYYDGATKKEKKNYRPHCTSIKIVLGERYKFFF